MCSRSAVNTGRPPIKRRNTDRVVSRIGRPKETIGIAIAITVGAFSEPASAKALSINPMNKLPQSPRKMVAGLKLNRRNPRMAPARAIVSSDMDDEPLEIATTKTTEVENNAEPAASPSRLGCRELEVDQLPLSVSRNYNRDALPHLEARLLRWSNLLLSD